MRDAEAGRKAQQRAPQEDDAGQLFTAVVALRQGPCGHYRGDAAQKSAQFDDSVGPGELSLRDQLRQ